MSSLPHQPPFEAAHEDATATRVEELYVQYAGLVRSVCRSLLRDRAETDDAVQQTFLSAQRALLNGSSPRNAAAWLAAIARHESLARVHARMRDPLPVDTEAEAAGPDAHALAVGRQEAGELRDALAELPPQQRAAILLREVRGFSYEEVASTLSVTPAAVESLIFRARRSLQLRLREALAAFSPGMAWRNLAARIGGGAAGPAAAKAAAVGVGAAVITGGALVGPRVAGLGHAPRSGPAASAGTVEHHSRGSVPLGLPSRFDVRVAASSIAGDARTRSAAGHDPSRNEASRPDRSDRGEGTSRTGSDGGGDSSSTLESGSSDSHGSTATSSADTATTNSGKDGTSTDSSSQTTEPQSTTETTTTTTTTSPDGSGGSDGSALPDGSGTTGGTGGD
jgi:RNA polymerase sigma-70 factor, ECF subfamily